MPVATLGNLLDSDAVRIAAALRLGAPICLPHTCSCGKVDGFGHHDLSCKFSAGRRSRHSALNEVVRRILVSAGTPAVLEPPGLTREKKNLRSDGKTLIPWHHGKALAWDVTVVDTLADSYITSTSKTAGTAAEVAEEKKRVKYASLSDNHIFSPLGLKPWDHAERMLFRLSRKSANSLWNGLETHDHRISYVSELV